MSSSILRWILNFCLFSLISTFAAAQGGGGGRGGARELWCVSMNNAEDAALQSAIDWACGPGGADCGPIQKGGPCYDPSDLGRTASYAFNDYYRKHSSSDDSCSFSNTAALTSINPSHDNCKIPSSLIQSNGNSSGGSVLPGSESADLSSNSSIAHNWSWGLINSYLFFVILLLF